MFPCCGSDQNACCGSLKSVDVTDRNLNVVLEADSEEQARALKSLIEAWSQLCKC